MSQRLCALLLFISLSVEAQCVLVGVKGGIPITPDFHATRNQNPPNLTDFISRQITTARYNGQPYIRSGLPSNSAWHNASGWKWTLYTAAPITTTPRYAI